MEGDFIWNLLPFLIHNKVPNTLYILILTFLISTSFVLNNDGKEALIDKVLNRMASVNTFSCVLKNAERIDGEMLEGQQHIILQQNPFKLSVKCISPNEGDKLIYVEGQNRNKAVYDPKGFPYVSLTLDPFGSLIRENNHHTIFDIGYKKFYRLINAISKDSDWKQDVIYGDTLIDKVLTHKIIFNNTNYEISSELLSNESLEDFIERNLLNEYKIREVNYPRNIESLIASNKSILVTKGYCRMIEMYVSETTHAPLMFKIYDEYGLYEAYEFIDLKLNLELKPKDFSI